MDKIISGENQVWHYLRIISKEKPTQRSWLRSTSFPKMLLAALYTTPMRLFLAIPLDEAVIAELTRLTARLRPSAPALRWSRPESWHITLQFLGNATPAQYDCLLARLAQLRSPPVPIRLTELGVFERAGIFYAGVALSPPLLALQERVLATTAPCGFEPESRLFHPHITLARSKPPARATRLHSLIRVQPQFPPFTAVEFLLYESHLSSSGSNYSIRHRFPFAAS